MPREASYAMQRACEEIERVVWPIDRAISDENPKRKYWIRPAHPIEVAQRELSEEQPMPVPSPGRRYYMVVYEPRRGVRIRLPFVADDIGDACRDVPEALCKECYEHHASPGTVAIVSGLKRAFE